MAPRMYIDLTTDDDVEKERFNTSLLHLPNELLINVLKERSARDYLLLSATSRAHAQRLQQIDNDMFRYYLQRDFTETIPRNLDARTAYLVRARLPLLRFFELTKMSESNIEHELSGRYFFRPSMTMALNFQIATILEKIYPKSIGKYTPVANNEDDDEDEFEFENFYALSISEQLSQKQGAWIPSMMQNIGGSSIAHIVRKLRTIDLVDESDNVTWHSNIQPQLLSFLTPELADVEEDSIFRYYLQRDFAQTIPASFDAKTAYLMWQWHMSPAATHVVTVWQGYQREEPDEVLFRLFSVPKDMSLKHAAARAIGPIDPSNDRPDADLLRLNMHQYEALVSDDITRFLEGEIGDTLDMPSIEERFNLKFSEHVSGHTIRDIIQKLNA